MSRCPNLEEMAESVGHLKNIYTLEFQGGQPGTVHRSRYDLRLFASPLF